MPLSDDALRELIRTQPDSGWRAFIDQYTPLLVGLIRRTGVDDRDEIMEVYVLICERLSARGFEALKSQSGGRGSIGGWLAVVARHAAVDWLRSRKGRRRLFHAVRDLSPFEQRVFELFYWEERTPPEISQIIAQESRCPADLPAVLDALDRIQGTLSDRHRAELLSMSLRAKAPVALEETNAAETIADSRVDPETAARVRELNNALETALRGLTTEEAAIVRLKYVEGLTNTDIESAIGTTITAGRLRDILGRLRTLLTGLGMEAADTAFARRLSIEGRES